MAQYQTPSVGWETKYRTINGRNVAYEFGKGNPAEVALKPEQYRATATKDGIPYVTPQAETSLKAFLETPQLRLIVEKCRPYFAGNSVADQENAALDTKNLALENMLYIDERTQRKEIRQDVLEGFGNVMAQLRAPLSDDGSRIAKQCLTEAERQYLPALDNQFSEIGRNYFNTQGNPNE